MIGNYSAPRASEAVRSTCDLAQDGRLAERVPTFHIAEPDGLTSPREIRHRPVGAPSTATGIEVTTRDWLPPSRPLTIGLTAGASTPNNIVGEVIRRLDRYANAV